MAGVIGEHIMPAWDYDLVAAYPNELIKLQDTRNMDIIESEDYQENAIYGYALCNFWIRPDVVVHPILHADEYGFLSTPNGDRQEILTKGQIDFLSRWHLCDDKHGAPQIDILSGHWMMPKIPYRASYPLAASVERLLKYKENGNELVHNLAKAMAVGIGGKLGEEFKHTVGKFFNPMWRAEMVTRCAMKVCEFVYKKRAWNDLIQVRIDGCLLTKPVEGELPQGWKLKGHSEALAITSGQTFFGSQHPDGFTLSDTLTMLREHPGIGYYESKHQEIITLNSAWGLKKPELCGKTQTVVDTIDLYRLNPERHFKELPQTGGELMSKIYTSEPKII